jgi:putative PIN family toxin of toxin-antitoxin system
MIRIVIDTNVLVSGFISLAKGFEQAYSRRILQAVRDDIAIPLTSFAALEELEAVMNRPHIVKRHGKTPDQVAESIDEFSRLCRFVPTEIAVTAVEDDPEDDLFLTIAIAGKANAIISGDPHLLKLREFRGIPIMSPKAFVDMFLMTD